MIKNRRKKRKKERNGLIFGVVVPSLDLHITCPGPKIKDIKPFHCLKFLQNYYFIKILK
jgi:hypothetical protein